MAERRMFAKTIIDSDAFIDMPVSARLLYYDLSMRADDEGFVNSPKKIMKMTGTSEDDLRILIAKKFILPFETGIVVIKHWYIHNYIRKDTFKNTTYIQEKECLELDENKAYHVKTELRRRSVDEPSTQVRLGKVSIGKDKDILSETEVSDDASLDEQETLKLFDDTPNGGENKTKDDKIPYKEIIDYLNEKIGSQYRYKAKSTKDKIHARYSEGFTFDDFKAVIDFKHEEWGNDPKMCKYLRPETLFGTKFESYLNQRGVEENAEPTKSLAGTKDKYGIPIL